jgi:hypothetical protein
MPSVTPCCAERYSACPCAAGRRTIGIGDFVGRLLLIDAAVAVGLSVFWYFFFASYNRRRALEALRWVETACSKEGRIAQVRWLGTSSLQAQVNFATHWFDQARVMVHLFPRPLPFKWLYFLCRKQKETLTFEADLDYAPGGLLEVFRHRWVTGNQVPPDEDSRQWSLVRPGPVVFTTASQWTQELPPVVRTFMTSRGHTLLSVRLRSQSPHLAVTISLEALSDGESAAGFMKVLRDLAAGASASRQ